MSGVSVNELESFLTQRCPRYPSAGIKRAAMTGGMLSLTVFGIIFFLFSVPFIVVFFPWRLHQQVRLSRVTPATAPGRVTEAPDSNLRVNDVPVYTVRFTFTVDGVEWDGVSYSTGRRYEPGQSVSIEYVSDAPHIARITGTDISSTGWFGLIVLIFPLAGISIAYGGVHSYRSKMRLLRHGLFAAGTIREVAATNVRINHQTVYRIDVAFQTRNGKEQQSAYKTWQSREIDLARTKQAAAETVGVLYLPAHPARVLFVDGLVKKV